VGPPTRRWPRANGREPAEWRCLLLCRLCAGWWTVLSGDKPRVAMPGLCLAASPGRYHQGELSFARNGCGPPESVQLWLVGLGRFSRSSCQISEPRCIVRNSALRAFRRTGDSSSGRTTDSGSVWRGSNPLSPAIKEAFRTSLREETPSSGITADIDQTLEGVGKIRVRIPLAGDGVTVVRDSSVEFSLSS
jgi:hypothetical protein